MNLPQCDREQEVLDALRSGRWASAWGAELRQHAATCAVCAEVAFVAQEFRREAELAPAELPAGLPSAGLIWWKAQRAARREAEQRAAEPILLVERAAYALGALVTLGLGIWQRPRITAWLHHSPSPAPSHPLMALSEHPSSGDWLHRLAPSWPAQAQLFLLAASAVAFLTFMAFAAYAVWRED